MKILQVGATGAQVQLLQKLVSKVDGHFVNSGKFDESTLAAVKNYQAAKGLEPDGIVGNKTWAALLNDRYSFTLGVKNHPLSEGEYIKEVFPKDTIILHHTAGRYRPDFTIQGWNADGAGKRLRVATAFVIGGRGFDGDSTFDGKTLRAFNEIYWAHHLGLKLPQNDPLNQQSIAIEICALGALLKQDNGTFKAAAYPDKNILVPASEVCQLPSPFRGFTYFQKYTAKQIEECKRIVLTMAFLFDIELPDRRHDASWFELNQDALNGKPGLWTHTNVRSDKSDCFPQPEFIDMLNSLHASQKTFTIPASSLEDLLTDIPTLENHNAGFKGALPIDLAEYSSDLNDINEE